jgi:hypothetical protein
MLPVSVVIALSVLLGSIQSPRVELPENRMAAAYVSTSAERSEGVKGEFGIKFDTRGAEFGPWIAAFVRKVKAKWTVPNDPASAHVTVTCDVHRDGTITDITLTVPSSVDAFNNSATASLQGANPVDALPRDYLLDTLTLQATFYFNEEPPR